MIAGRCPICSKSYAVAAITDLPTFPFCSARCRTIDQARWADGAYLIPGPPAPSPTPPGEIPGDEED